MSRKKTGSFMRELIPEGRYGSLIATKFINCLMFSGKKSISEGIFYEALDKMTAKVKAEGVSPIELFNQAIENVKPLVEVKSRRVGGAQGNFVQQAPKDIGKQAEDAHDQSTRSEIAQPDG